MGKETQRSGVATSLLYQAHKFNKFFAHSKKYFQVIKVISESFLPYDKNIIIYILLLHPVTKSLSEMFLKFLYWIDVWMAAEYS